MASSYDPSVHHQEADYPRLCVGNMDVPGPVTNVQGQAEVRNSRRSGEQSGLAIPGLTPFCFLATLRTSILLIL